MVKKLWHDPVWSAVIAGLIVTGTLALLTYFLNLWPPIWEFLKNGFYFFLASSEIPHWVVGLLVLFSLPTFFLFFILLKKDKGPDWRSYREDIFLNLKWRWNYEKDGYIYPLCPFCLYCDFQIIPKNTSAYIAVDRIAFECDNCQHQFGEYQESIESIENKVKRSIQQKLRNGTWLEKINV